MAALKYFFLILVLTGSSMLLGAQSSQSLTVHLGIDREIPGYEWIKQTLEFWAKRNHFYLQTKDKASLAEADFLIAQETAPEVKAAGPWKTSIPLPFLQGRLGGKTIQAGAPGAIPLYWFTPYIVFRHKTQAPQEPKALGDLSSSVLIDATSSFRLLSDDYIKPLSKPAFSYQPRELEPWTTLDLLTDKYPQSYLFSHGSAIRYIQDTEDLGWSQIGSPGFPEALVLVPGKTCTKEKEALLKDLLADIYSEEVQVEAWQSEGLFPITPLAPEKLATHPQEREFLKFLQALTTQKLQPFPGVWLRDLPDLPGLSLQRQSEERGKFVEWAKQVTAKTYAPGIVLSKEEKFIPPLVNYSGQIPVLEILLKECKDPQVVGLMAQEIQALLRDPDFMTFNSEKILTQLILPWLGYKDISFFKGFLKDPRVKERIQQRIDTFSYFLGPDDLLIPGLKTLMDMKVISENQLDFIGERIGSNIFDFIRKRGFGGYQELVKAFPQFKPQGQLVLLNLARANLDVSILKALINEGVNLAQVPSWDREIPKSMALDLLIYPQERVWSEQGPVKPLEPGYIQNAVGLLIPDQKKTWFKELGLRMASFSRLEEIKLMESLGMDLKVKDSEGNSVLHPGAANPDPRVLPYLFTKVGAFGIKNSFGANPWQTTLVKPAPGLWLLSQGIYPDSEKLRSFLDRETVKETRNNPLGSTLSWGKIRKDMTWPPEVDQAVLTYLMETGDLKSFKELKALGAQVNADLKDRRGTPVEFRNLVNWVEASSFEGWDSKSSGSPEELIFKHKDLPGLEAWLNTNPSYPGLNPYQQGMAQWFIESRWIPGIRRIIEANPDLVKAYWSSLGFGEGLAGGYKERYFGTGTAYLESSLEVFSEMLKQGQTQGLELFGRNNQGLPMSHVLIFQKNSQYFKLALKMGMPMDLLDPEDRSVLDRALVKNALEDRAFLEFLYEKGARFTEDFSLPTYGVSLALPYFFQLKDEDLKFLKVIGFNFTRALDDLERNRGDYNWEIPPRDQIEEKFHGLGLLE